MLPSTLGGTQESKQVTSAKVKAGQLPKAQWGEPNGAPFVALLSGNKAIDTQALFEGNLAKKKDVLTTLERARSAQIIGEFDKSVAIYSKALDEIKSLEDSARYSLSGAGGQLLAIAVNDTVLSYDVPAYEAVLAHHYQGLNYLFKGKLEEAGVEVRISNALQTEQLKRYEKEVAKAKSGSSKSTSWDSTSAGSFKEFASLNTAAGKIKNSFQNAYTFVFSALIHELMNEPNDAYIDYKKALEIYPENAFLQGDAIRLAKSLGMTEDLSDLKKRFPRAVVKESNKDKSEIITFFENDFVEPRVGVMIPIPIPGVGVSALAFPTYKGVTSKYTAPTLSLKAGGQIAAPQPIVKIQSLSAKALQEDVPFIVTRQILRTVGKGFMADALGRVGGGWAAAAASTYNVLSEVADTRSWITIPANVGFSRQYVSAGANQLTVRHPQAGQESIALNIAPNSKTILIVQKTGKFLRIHQVSIPFNKKA